MIDRLTSGFETYLVGGAVRDQLLGIAPHDYDFVCIGANMQQMVERGFVVSKIHKHQIVFTHKDAPNCQFSIPTNPNDLLSDDLGKRDFTINAIARNIKTGQLIDPFNGQSDLINRTIRAIHVDSLIDDPTRVYRACRLATTLDFEICRTTKFNISNLDLRDQLQTQPKERVGNELMRVCNSQTSNPRRFFDLLRAFGLLDIHFKEIDDLIGVVQPAKWHPEGDVYEHTMQVLQLTGSFVGDRAPIGVSRLAAITHDFGKALTPAGKLPSHPQHEVAGVPLAREFCKRLAISNQHRDICEFTTRMHMYPHLVGTMGPSGYAKASRYVDRNIKNLVLPHLYDLCCSDARGRGEQNLHQPIDHVKFFVDVLDRLADYKISDHVLDQQTISQMSTSAIQNKIFTDKRNIVKQMMEQDKWYSTKYGK